MKQLDTEEVVKQRFPEAVALVVSKDTEGKVNLCPVGFFSLMAWKPKVWAIGLYESHYSTKVIGDTNEFVLCLPAMEQVKDVLYAGSVHGWHIDKTKQTHLTFLQSTHVAPPLIDGAIACFECKVVQKHIVFDHTVFFGEVIASHGTEKTWHDKVYHWDDTRLGTMQYGDLSVDIPYSPEGSVKKT